MITTIAKITDDKTYNDDYTYEQEDRLGIEMAKNPPDIDFLD